MHTLAICERDRPPIDWGKREGRDLAVRVSFRRMRPCIVFRGSLVSARWLRGRAPFGVGPSIFADSMRTAGSTQGLERRETGAPWTKLTTSGPACSAPSLPACLSSRERRAVGPDLRRQRHLASSLRTVRMIDDVVVRRQRRHRQS